jgi:hypothetical protein
MVIFLVLRKFKQTGGLNPTIFKNWTVQIFGPRLPSIPWASG